jgi:GNAT superfamily N-acetyltransferase
MPECARLWDVSIGDYMARLNQPWFGGDLEPLLRLLSHFLGTDPDLFVCATLADDDDLPVGYGSATRRGSAWFLAMLFVRPDVQGNGVGRSLLEQILPLAADDLSRGTATDAAQPISNALYASFGLVPRIPVLRLVGRPDRRDALVPLPAGVTALAIGPHEDIDAELAVLDRSALGYAHPEDHAWFLAEGRQRFLFRRDGAAVGYGYIAPTGRFGPIAALDPGLVAPIAAHLLSVAAAPGAYASWIPGPAGDLVSMLLQAGFVLEGFPTLVCWDRPFADFARYVPLGLALL